MRTHSPAVVVATVAVTLAAGGGVALAASVRKLSVVLHSDSLTVVDTGTPGSSPGDLVVEDDTVLRDGKAVGRASFTCVVIGGDVVNSKAECSGSFYLKKGQLETQGSARSVSGAISGKGAITGGTRKYEGVRGSYRFSTVAGGNRAVKIRLVR